MEEIRSVVIRIIRAGREKSYLKREWVLLFLRMQCSIFEAIYFDPLTPSLSPCLPAGRLWGEGDVEEEGRNYEQG